MSYNCKLSVALPHGAVSWSAVSQGGGGGGTLIFSYIRRLGPFFGVQNFEFRFFWVVR